MTFSPIGENLWGFAFSSPLGQRRGLFYTRRKLIQAPSLLFGDVLAVNDLIKFDLEVKARIRHEAGLVDRVDLGGIRSAGERLFTVVFLNNSAFRALLER